jgi:hypothetical protein
MLSLASQPGEHIHLVACALTPAGDDASTEMSSELRWRRMVRTVTVQGGSVPFNYNKQNTMNIFYFLWKGRERGCRIVTSVTWNEAYAPWKAQSGSTGCVRPRSTAGRESRTDPGDRLRSYGDGDDALSPLPV